MNNNSGAVVILPLRNCIKGAVVAYSTLEDLKKYMPEKAIIEITDDDDTGDINTEITTDATLQADNLIDVYMRSRYPSDMANLSDVPEFIRDLSVKLTAYNLYKRTLITTLPEPIKLDYKDAIQMLRDIQSEKISPFPKTQGPIKFRTNKTSGSRVFNSTTWGTYHTV